MLKQAFVQVREVSLGVSRRSHALVHLNDAPDKPPRQIEDEDRLMPGEGVIKLATLIGELKTRKYSGPWSLETFNPAYWKDDAEKVARRGLAAITRVLP